MAVAVVASSGMGDAAHTGHTAAARADATTPWGEADSVTEIADGIVYYTTPSHGGLRLSAERWAQIPSALADTFHTAGWAEQDCETPLAIALLGVDPRPRFTWTLSEFRAHARVIAQHYSLYAPALAHLSDAGP